MVTSGLLLDWKELKCVDFDNPWWNTEMQETISIAGKMFWASGDITMTWQGFGALLPALPSTGSSAQVSTSPRRTQTDARNSI